MKIILTKDDARQLLAINVGNRDMEDRKVAYYCNLMDSNFWYVGGSAIEICSGILVNGQHRLTAFINSKLDELTFNFKLL